MGRNEAEGRRRNVAHLDLVKTAECTAPFVNHKLEKSTRFGEISWLLFFPSFISFESASEAKCRRLLGAHKEAISSKDIIISCANRWKSIKFNFSINIRLPQNSLKSAWADPSSESDWREVNTCLRANNYSGSSQWWLHKVGWMIDDL